MSSTPFGTFTSRGEVRQQVLLTLQTWILTYLAEVERQEGLAPRTVPQPGGAPPNSSLAIYPPTAPGFRPGLDFEVWQTDQLPLLTVLAQPTGEAERYEAGKYAQWYEVQVAATVEDPGGEETVAQQLADRYGKALMALLAQQGGLGTRRDDTGAIVPFAEKTVLIAAPRTEFVDGADRKFARSVTVVHTLVERVADESQGPRVPPLDPYQTAQPWPTVGQVDFVLSAENAAGTVSPATGVTVTKPVTGGGEVTVTE